MRWPPVTFISGTLNFSADVGDGAQFLRVGQAAPHARHHGEAAVLLDVAVGALVDVARLGVVLVFVGPGAQQVVVERGAALGRSRPASSSPGSAWCPARSSGPVRRWRRGPRRGCARCSRTAASSTARRSSRRPRSPPATSRPGRCRSRRSRKPWCGRAPRPGEQLLVADGLTMSPLHTPLQPQISVLSGIAVDAGLLVAVAGVAQVAAGRTAACRGSWKRRWHRASARNTRRRPGCRRRARRRPVVVLQHQLLVGAAPDVLEHDFLAPSPPLKLPAENRSMPVTLSLVEVIEPS